MTEEEKIWLNSAVSLDWGLTLYKDYAKFIVNIIYDHIFDKENKKYRKVLIKIISNLRRAYDLGVPLRYSKNAHNYTNYYKNYNCGYRVVMLIMDKLLQKDLITQYSNTFFNNGDGNSKLWSRQTRIWASDNLIGIFKPIQPEDIVKEPPQLLQLRERITKKDKLKGKIAKQLSFAYSKDILLMEKQLFEFHKLLAGNRITLEVVIENLIKDLEPERKEVVENFINNIMNKSYKHAVWGDLQKNRIYGILENKDKKHCRIQYNSSNNSIQYTKDIVVYNHYTPMTNNIWVILKYNYMLRVFSESFNLGGRFYGSGWSSMPKELRKHLKINFESVCEPDYSGLHIRLLYHKLGIQFDGECYICGDYPRDLYKTACLILINARPGDPYKAVSSAFKLREFYLKFPGCLKKDYVLPIVNDIYKYHKKISEYFFSDIGIELQNIDGRITSNIMDYFIRRKIVILPVHDSYVIAERHREELIEVMTAEYEKVMKFKPVVT